MMWDSLPGGRASLTLPRAILRVATEKAGAGGCRLGFFGQGAFTGMGFPTAPCPKKPAVYRQRAFSLLVIRLGFEPKTHSLEGCCSNPTELRNQKRLQRYIIFLIWQIILLKYFSFFDGCSLGLAFFG